MINTLALAWAWAARVATQNRVIYSNVLVFDCQQENKMKWNDINMRSNDTHSRSLWHSCTFEAGDRSFQVKSDRLEVKEEKKA